MARSNAPLHTYVAVTAPARHDQSIHMFLIDVNETVARARRKHGIASRVVNVFVNPLGEYVAVIEHPENVFIPED